MSREVCGPLGCPNGQGQDRTGTGAMTREELSPAGLDRGISGLMVRVGSGAGVRRSRRPLPGRPTSNPSHPSPSSGVPVWLDALRRCDATGVAGSTSTDAFLDAWLVARVTSMSPFICLTARNQHARSSFQTLACAVGGHGMETPLTQMPWTVEVYMKGIRESFGFLLHNSLLPSVPVCCTISSFQTPSRSILPTNPAHPVGSCISKPCAGLCYHSFELSVYPGQAIHRLDPSVTSGQ